MRIHVSLEPDDAHRALLRSALAAVGSASLTFGPDLPALASDEPGLNVLVNGRPAHEALAAVVPGGALVIPYSGLPARTRDQLADRPDLRVYNLHHNAELVAEHAVALLLAASRRLVPIDRAFRAGDWRARYLPDDSPHLRGQRALILGYGAIGRCVGNALTGLGMEVVGLRRTQAPSLDQLDALLPTARALVIALPRTPQTEGLLDARRLAQLDPKAVLVNIARGAICDEPALFEALRDRRLYAAGLDVWWRYPGEDAREHTPPAEAPFHELDNVVLSPHRAGHADATERLRTEHLATVLAALAGGREPATRIDPGRGY